MPLRLGVFYDTNEVHTFVVTVSGGHAYLLDYDNPMDLPIAQAIADYNHEAVVALFDKVNIPDDMED